MKRKTNNTSRQSYVIVFKKKVADKDKVAIMWIRPIFNVCRQCLTFNAGIDKMLYLYASLEIHSEGYFYLAPYTILPPMSFFYIHFLGSR